MWNVVEFKGINEMQQACDSVATFQLVPTFVRTPGQGSKLSRTRFRGVWNNALGEVVSMVTERFYLVQSRSVFQEVANIIGNNSELSENVVGYIRESPVKAILTFWFSHESLTLRNGETIQLGFRFINSVDKSGSFVGSFFGFQGICTNGMIFKKTVHKMVRHRHTKRFDVHRAIMKMFENLPVIESDLNKAFDRAISDIVFKEDVVRILEYLRIAKKYHDKIYEKVKENRISRWDLYVELTNIVTNRFTRGRGTRSGQLRLENKIEDLLCTDSKALIQRIDAEREGIQYL